MLPLPDEAQGPPLEFLILPTKLPIPLLSFTEVPETLGAFHRRSITVQTSERCGPPSDASEDRGPHPLISMHFLHFRFP